MKPILMLLFAFIGPVVMGFLWKHADKIRESKFWPIGMLAWIYVSANTIGAWFALVNEAGVKLPPEEVMVPIFFGVMMLVLAVTWYFCIYRPMRKHKKAIY